MIDAAVQAEAVRYERLRTQVLNAVMQAERGREKDPQSALDLLDRTVIGCRVKRTVAGPACSATRFDRSLAGVDR